MGQYLKFSGMKKLVELLGNGGQMHQNSGAPFTFIFEGERNGTILIDNILDKSDFFDYFFESL